MIILNEKKKLLEPYKLTGDNEGRNKIILHLYFGG